MKNSKKLTQKDSSPDPKRQKLLKRSKMDILLSLPKRDIIVGDPDDLVYIDLFEWDEVKNL